ncbi:MAG: DUF1826 domain-containing protein [Pseudomonadota bacterium]
MVRASLDRAQGLRASALAHDGEAIRRQHPWRALLDPQVACLILPARGEVSAPVLEAVCATRDFSMRVMGTKEQLSSILREEMAGELADYIEPLLQDYTAFTAVSVMRVRLEVITSSACWKWHEDYTTLRLITTLHGAGTEYLSDPDRRDAISQCQDGEIGLFKGKLFGSYFGLEGHSACVHRSPPWTAGDRPRLLLVIDTPQDFEIEQI